jgi:hypothetical protein
VGISVLDRRYFDYSELNYTEFDVFCGPVWDRKKYIISVPFGFTQKLFGDEALSGIFHAGLHGERFVNDQWRLRAKLRLSSESYSKDDFKDAGLDNEKLYCSLGATWKMATNQEISAMAAGEKQAADADHQSYDLMAVSISYFTRIVADIDLYLIYKISDYKYDDPNPWYNTVREDTRHVVSISLAKDLWENLFGAVKYSYLNNNSNQGLYDFDKQTVSLKLGLRF